MLAALGGGMRVTACGLDDLIACGLTQVVAALSLRPSAFGLGACAFAWVHQLIRPGWAGVGPLVSVIANVWN